MSTPAGTPPNTAVIPLPPGMDLQQYLTLQGQVGMFKSTIFLDGKPDHLTLRSHHRYYRRRCLQCPTLGFVGTSINYDHRHTLTACVILALLCFPTRSLSIETRKRSCGEPQRHGCE